MHASLLKMESLPWSDFTSVLYTHVLTDMHNVMKYVTIGVGTMHGGSGGWCPPMSPNIILYYGFDMYIHIIHCQALAYRSIEPRFIEPSSYA